MEQTVFIHNTAEVSEKAVIGKGTKIGSRVKLQNNVNVYHGVEIEDDVFVGPSATFTNDMYPRSFNSDFKVYKTLVKKGASIGANATIVCGITIGEYDMIGAGSVVTKDVKSYSLVVGNPGKVIGFVCQCGHRLNNDLHCPNCGKGYRITNDNLEKY